MKEPETQPVIEKINNYKISGYNTSGDWTDLDSCTPS
jgi:hypothetical protein